MTVLLSLPLDPFPLRGLRPSGACLLPSFSSSCLHRQISYPNQVVGRGGEGEHPSDLCESPMSCLPHQPHGLQPTEDLLDPFALPLAQKVSGVPGRPSIDAAVARVLASDVRGDVDGAKG